MLDVAPAETEKLQARIVVIGTGGAGCNAINNMIEKKLPGVQFVAMNTDTQSLGRSVAPTKIQLGVEATEGLGAGSNPDVGRAATLESEQKIQSVLKNAHMVFITAGMGGGTGTGSAPQIARLSRELGILTVGVVTKPFNFERRRRAEIAEEGIRELQQFVDTLIVIPNQNLFQLEDGPATLTDAFRRADDVLLSGVRGVTDLIVREGVINLDFNDIKTVMKEQGKAVMGTGEASGEGRAREAALKAINNPLLEDISLSGAQSLLINITSGNDVGLREPDEAIQCITEEVDEDPLVIFGWTIDEDLGDVIRVSVIATGVNFARRSSGLGAIPAQAEPAAKPHDSGVEVGETQSFAPVAPPAMPSTLAVPEAGSQAVESARVATATHSTVSAPNEPVFQGSDLFYSAPASESASEATSEVIAPTSASVRPAAQEASNVVSSPLSVMRRRTQQPASGEKSGMALNVTIPSFLQQPPSDD